MARKSFSAFINEDLSSLFTKVINLETVSKLVVQLVVTPSTPAAKAFSAGTAEVQTVTWLTKANTVAGDYVVIAAQDGLTYAIYADTTGSVAAPSGAIYTAIPAARKAKADISGSTTAADVAAVFETSFDALTGFTAKCVTDDSAADGTMLFTHAQHGTVTNPVVKDEDDSGAGTIVGAETTPGVAGDVIISADTITEVAHGYVTGLKGQLTTDGTLPAGLSLATDYFLIKVDVDTYQLASSLVNAQAGTQIDITDEGATANTHTFTPTATTGNVAKLQESVDGDSYEDLSGLTTTISGADVVIWKPDATAQFIKFVYTPSAGQTTVKVDLSQVTTQ